MAAAASATFSVSRWNHRVVSRTAETEANYARQPGSTAVPGAVHKSSRQSECEAVIFIEGKFVANQESTSSSDKILTAATRIAQAHGYGGLNLRTLAQEVGIKAASLYHHFPSKADLAAAVAKRYWEDAAAALEVLSAKTPDLPDVVKIEIQAFADVNVAWLGKNLVAAGIVGSRDAKKRARAIFAAVSGAQLMARGRSDIKLFDALIDSYRSAGLLPE
jgi:TetR/AcrR family transcriptional repressor of nem operon